MAILTKLVIPGLPTLAPPVDIIQAAYNDTPLTGALYVDFQFCFPVPKSVSKKVRDDMLSGRILHTSTPRYGALEEAWTRALTGVVWVDDSRIVTCVTTRLYADVPRTEIQIAEMMEQELAMCRRGMPIRIEAA